MQQYEIHVGNGGRNRRIYPSLQLNDHAAVRRAQSLASCCEQVEVWRADVCVYARAAKELGAAYGKI